MSAAEREKYCVNFSMEEEEIFGFFYLWVHEGAGAYNRGLYRKVTEKKKEGDDNRRCRDLFGPNAAIHPKLARH